MGVASDITSYVIVTEPRLSSLVVATYVDENIIYTHTNKNGQIINPTLLFNI